MSWPTIHKAPSSDCPANMPDYDAESKHFAWAAVFKELTRETRGSLNIANVALERNIRNGLQDKAALIWIARNGARTSLTYQALSDHANRFANVLRLLQVARGERVYSLLGRVPELYIAALGTLKAGSVFCPLFSAFGPEPVKARLEIGDAKVLVTNRSLYKRKIAGIRSALPSLETVLLIDGDDARSAGDDVHDLKGLMASAPDRFESVQTNPQDMALLHFTSGTTGRPKGVVHVHEAVVAHHASGRLALDLKPGDVYWCTADPGWVTGTTYGIISPLTNGVTMIVDEGEFDPNRWYQILEQEKVSVWYTAPTAIRMLMKAGAELAQTRHYPNLRLLASVGEPLNPEAVIWGQKTFGRPFHDNWWQTETGAIMIANYASLDIKPGSMGKPLPGITAAIVERTDHTVREIHEPRQVGELALATGWPSMMRGYLHEETRYKKCFGNGWYLSGDLAMRDEDGYYWFIGRGDDLIKSAGHLIGPFEVESALIEHEAVAEAGVIGVDDATAGQIVKAFVALNPGYDATEPLRLELLGHARKRLGPAVAPKHIEFRANLPKTRSGKIMRRLLKARELGLPEGDLSTLESDEK